MFLSLTCRAWQSAGISSAWKRPFRRLDRRTVRTDNGNHSIYQMIFGRWSYSRLAYVLFFAHIVEISDMCYTPFVTAPILATGRGWPYGYTSIFCYLRIGQRSCLLPVQVAWWGWIVGNQAQTVGFSVKEEEPPNVLQYNRGFTLYALWTLQSFCLSALYHMHNEFAICLPWIFFRLHDTNSCSCSMSASYMK